MASTVVAGKNLIVKFMHGTFLGTLKQADAAASTPSANPAFYIASDAGDFSALDASSPDASLATTKAGDVLWYDGSDWTNTGVTGGAAAMACSTSCTMNVAQEFTDVSCKDSGAWVGRVEGNKSWDISTDNLYMTDDAVGKGGFVDLSKMVVDGPNSCLIAFEERNNPNNTTGNIWSGAAVLTSASITGANNESANYSASFMGNGPLHFTAAHS